MHAYLSVLINLCLWLPLTTTIPQKEVYLCDSPNAKKYHLRATCRGLSNCGSKIIKVGFDKARKDGKTLCKWEK